MFLKLAVSTWLFLRCTGLERYFIYLRLTTCHLYFTFVPPFVPPFVPTLVPTIVPTYVPTFVLILKRQKQTIQIGKK